MSDTADDADIISLEDVETDLERETIAGDEQSVYRVRTWVTVKEFGLLFSVSPATARRWCGEGVLPAQVGPVWSEGVIPVDVSLGNRKRRIDFGEANLRCMSQDQLATLTRMLATWPVDQHWGNDDLRLPLRVSPTRASDAPLRLIAAA